MFTGIVNTVGVIQELLRVNNQLFLKIKPKLPMSDFQQGESIAVNGCCLSINKFSESWFQVFVSVETFSCTNLKHLKTMALVNLERAVKFNDRIGGHIVTGHIDEVAKIKAICLDGNSKVITFAMSVKNSKFLIKKGSIAVDGISLTINECDLQQFTVNLIPETINTTTAFRWQVGYLANIEIDTLAKAAIIPNKINLITTALLHEYGYL